jgi:hypothetical protein
MIFRGFLGSSALAVRRKRANRLAEPGTCVGPC